jgi:hypothetical protein
MRKCLGMFDQKLIIGLVNEEMKIIMKLECLLLM